MRALISKVLTGSMIAGAALMVTACGGGNETATENTTVTDLNSTDTMGGMGDTMNDTMTGVDGSGNTGMMANDTMMSNDTMMGNDAMMSSNTMGTSSTTTTTTSNSM